MARLDRAHSDPKAIEHVLNGDHEAYTVLVERYYRVVFGFCFARLGIRDDAEDATQEAFMRAFESLAQLRNRRRFGPWIVSIAKNACRAVQRTNQKHASTDHGTLPAIGSLPDEIEQRELRETVHRHIVQIPQPYREALALHYIAGKKTREIADLLQISWGASRKRLQRGRELIGQTLSRELNQAILPEEAEQDRIRRTSALVLTTVSRPSLNAVPTPAPASPLTLPFAVKLPALLGGVAALTVVAGFVSFQFDRTLDTEDTSGNEVPQSTPAHELSPAVTLSDKGFTPPETIEDAVLRGIVRNELSEPIEGAEVLALQTDRDQIGQCLLATQWHPTFPSCSTTTGPDGHFTFPQLPESTYVVRAVSAGQLALAETQVEHGATQDIELVLKSASSLSGIVIDEHSRPIEGALLFPRATPGSPKIPQTHAYALSAASDADGCFHLPAVPDGSRQLLAQAPGYASRLTDPLASGTKEIRITLDKGARVAGRITNVIDRTPVGGVRVEASSGDYWQEFRFAESRPDGTFVLEHMTTGTYDLHVEDEFYASPTGKRPVHIDDTGFYSDYDFRVYPAGSIGGRVVTEDTNDGLEGVTVLAVYEQEKTAEIVAGTGRFDKVAHTGPDGSFHLSGLLPGRYAINVSGTSEYPGNRFATHARVHVPAGRTINDVQIAIPRGIAIQGRVVDTGQSPVSGVALDFYDEIAWSDCATRAFSDAAGAFRAWIVPGTDSFFIRAAAQEKASRAIGPINTNDAANQGVEVRVQPKSEIAGRLLNASGQPLDGWRLFFDEAGLEYSRGLSTRTDEEGRFAVRVMPPGPYSISYMPPNSTIRYSEKIATVNSDPGGRISDLLIRLDVEPTISGIVTDPAGHPLGNVKVVAQGIAFGVAHTNAKGEFEIIRLVDGNYKLTAILQGYSNATTTSIPAGSSHIRLRMQPSATLRGRVVSAGDGKAIREFRLVVVNGHIDSPTPEVYETLAAVADSQGRFTLPSLQTGIDQTLVVCAQGKTTTFVPLPKLQGSDAQDEVLVRMERGRVLYGKVVDGDDAPISKASLYVGALPDARQRRSVQVPNSGTHGEYVLDTLPAATAMVTAYHPDFAPEVVAVDAHSQSRIKKVIRLRPMAEISGRVSIDSTPQSAYIRYYYESAAGTASDVNTTDTQGRFTIIPLPAAIVTCEMSIGGTAPRHKLIHFRGRVETTPGQVTPVDFALPAMPAILEGKILVPNDTIELLSVTWSAPVGDVECYGTALLRTDNSYNIQNLPLGPITLEAAWQDQGLLHKTRYETVIEDASINRRDFELPGASHS